MRSISFSEWVFLTFILIYSFVPTFGGFFRVAELLGGVTIIPANSRALAQPLPIVLHILSSFLFCLLGALQFLPGIRRYHPSPHRMTGRVVAASGCTSALTGLWMTHFFVFLSELQSPLLYRVRIVLSITMLGLIVWSMMAIRARDMRAHGASMLRAYAIGQGASTQALLGLGWMAVIGTEPLASTRDGLMIAAWGLNLTVAELMISRLFAPRRLTA